MSSNPSDSWGETNQIIAYKPIGHVANRFDEPSQPESMLSTESRIVLNPALTDALYGLQPGQHLIILFHFHRAKDYKLRQHPRGNTRRPKTGVFTLRSPHRPNPIGFSTVELVEMKDNILSVKGLDALNGSPVLDIKPA